MISFEALQFSLSIEHELTKSTRPSLALLSSFVPQTNSPRKPKSTISLLGNGIKLDRLLSKILRVQLDSFVLPVSPPLLYPNGLLLLPQITDLFSPPLSFSETFDIRTFRISLGFRHASVLALPSPLPFELELDRPISSFIYLSPTLDTFS